MSRNENEGTRMPINGEGGGGGKTEGKMNT